MYYKIVMNLVMLSMVAICFFCNVARSSEFLPPPREPEQPTLPELQEEVDRLLAEHDNVRIRRDIAKVFLLVDLLMDEENVADARHYLAVGLQHNPWALAYQMKCAEIAARKGDADVAKENAALVFEHAETDELVLRAQTILGESHLNPIDQLLPIETDTITLVLVPIGSVDRIVLYELQQRLDAALQIPVKVRDAGVDIPAYARDPVARHLSAIRKNLIREMRQDSEFVAYLNEHGVDVSALEDEDNTMSALRHLSYLFGGTNGLERFDEGIRDLQQRPKQWDIQELLQSLATSVQPYLQTNTYFIGITHADTFSGDSNFVFGTGQNNGHLGAISYRRFSAAFNDETPNRERLVDRTQKQVLSTFGFMVGVVRCSTPTCARAYPHNLGEHDAKASEVCSTCRNGFDRVLGTID